MCPEGSWTDMPENTEVLTPVGHLVLWPSRVKVGGTCAGLGFSSAGYGLHFFILWAWGMSWETLLSIF